MEASGFNVIAVGDEDADRLTGLDIVAFQMAEPGAMGYHGGVFFVTSDKGIYFTCYLEPSAYSGHMKAMSWEKLEEVFPPLKGFDHGLMGYGARVPDGWRYGYLGMGNHLLIKDAIGDSFNLHAQELEDESPHEILYNRWMRAVVEALQEHS